jgi:hypothetical protein
MTNRKRSRLTIRLSYATTSITATATKLVVCRPGTIILVFSSKISHCRLFFHRGRHHSSIRQCVETKMLISNALHWLSHSPSFLEAFKNACTSRVGSKTVESRNIFFTAWFCFVCLCILQLTVIEEFLRSHTTRAAKLQRWRIIPTKSRDVAL